MVIPKRLKERIKELELSLFVQTALRNFKKVRSIQNKLLILKGRIDRRTSSKVSYNNTLTA